MKLKVFKMLLSNKYAIITTIPQPVISALTIRDKPWFHSCNSTLFFNVI